MRNHPTPRTSRQLLEEGLRKVLPMGRLSLQTLPEVASLRLLLLGDDEGLRRLDHETAARVMDRPLYWLFCWASGRVLARYLLQHPALVAGKRVVDFGSGSGVVAIAAALAGARESIACDIDPLARTAIVANAQLNDAPLTIAGDFEAVPGDLDLILAADVLYDAGNLRWLPRFTARSPTVLLADSRVRDFDEPPYRRIARQESCTMPDLDEAPAFRQVSLYRAGD
jgi:predicted nicotinamide N-methyase